MATSNKYTKDDYINALFKECYKQGITSPVEQAAMMAQFDHESAGFTRMVENLNYKPDRLMAISSTARKAGLANVTAACHKGPQAIANLMYGGRNGNTLPNDGWDFRGRGPTMLTFRGNYEAFKKATGVDIVSNPDLVLEPEIAAKVSIWFWVTNVKKRVKDFNDTAAVRKVINGGTIGLDDCKRKFAFYLPKMINMPKDSMLA